MHSRTSRRAALVVATALVVTTPLAAPADAKKAKKKAKSKSTTTLLAPNVALTHSVFNYKGQQRMFTLRINLDGHNELVAASPGNVVGAPRQSALTLGRQTGAVAGVNGDTFYFFDAAAVPRGGFSQNGRIMKSALLGKNAVLYTTNSGKAYIGNPGFDGNIATTDARGRSRGFKIRSVNSIENGRNGGLTLLDPSVMSSSLRKRPQKPTDCTIVRLADLGGTSYQVQGMQYHASSYGRAAAGTHALLSCAGTTTAWIRDALRPGQRITAAVGYHTQGIKMLLSANKQLIRNGKRFNDRTGISVYGHQKKPNTFGCVLRGNRSVLLGVVEGDRKGRAGMTYATLTSYLLTRGCTSAVVFDGSGSSTLVARRPGQALRIMNKVTAPGGLRKVVNGLYVVRK